MENIRNVVRESFGYTVINPLALGFTLLMGLFLFFLPRKYAIIAMILTAVFITHMQRLVIGSLDFDMLRILLVFGWLRVMIRSEYRGFQFNLIDKVLIAWVIVYTATYIVLVKTFDAFVLRLGYTYDVLGIYFISRMLIRNIEDMIPAVKAMIIVSIPVALAMVVEQLTGRNWFHIFGGVREFTVIRDGRLRSQGAFSHPLMAGSFGASLLPLIWGLWHEKAHKLLLISGFAAVLTIIFTCSSSGPVLALAGGMLGLLLWPLRGYTRYVLWLIVCLALLVQVFMTSPVWALIYRLNLLGGSTGYHRFALIDSAIRNIGEWWLYGTRGTAYWGWGLQDVTNQFIRICVDGGLFSFGLFVTIIYLSFKTVGRATRLLEDPNAMKFVWALGVTLLTHQISFIGVSYFGQIVLFWYLLLAMISTVMNQCPKSTTDFSYNISLNPVKI